ncbi:MAG: hypothetical protein KDB00_04760, partial [Planctomycetales bacterium]|nr:hypothetical protein [Planctomycetales bacterium]
MKKVVTVARAEYLIAVTSKAFLLGVAMMPLFMGGAILVQYLTKDQVDLTPRKIAIVDETGKLYQVIAAQAEVHNEHEIYDGSGQKRNQVQAKFIIEDASPPTASDESQTQANDRVDARLSKRVKDGDLFAFAIIDKNVFQPDGVSAIRYHSQTPSYMSLSNWLHGVVNAEIKRVRSEQLGLSPESVAALSMQTPVRQFGLVELDENGDVSDAKEENRILTLVVPFGGLMLMFMM